MKLRLAVTAGLFAVLAARVSSAQQLAQQDVSIGYQGLPSRAGAASRTAFSSPKAS